MPKYVLNNKSKEPIVSMIEHTYRGRQYVMVATERSVYVMVPKEGDNPPYLTPIPFEEKLSELSEERLAEVMKEVRDDIMVSCPRCNKVHLRGGECNAD